MKSIIDICSLSASVGDILQTSTQHKRSLEQEKQQHEEEIKLMKEQFQRELSTARQTYLLSAYNDVEQYFQELNENLINGSREAERDMVDQRNQQFQTILVAATMMLTALLSILYQGQLPDNYTTWFYTSYAVCNTASFLFLLVSTFLGIIITSRVNRYMVKRSEANISHLTQAMDQTKQMMRHIRGDVFHLVNSAQPLTQSTKTSSMKRNVKRDNSSSKENNNTGVTAGKEESKNSGKDSGKDSGKHSGSSKSMKLFTNPLKRTHSTEPSSSSSKQHTHSHTHPCKSTSFNSTASGVSSNPIECDYRTRQKIAILTDDALEEEWKRHEEEVFKYLDRRGKMNERMELLAIDLNHAYRISFQRYWQKRCKTMGNSCLVCFYIGTTLLMITTMLYMYGSLTQNYHSLIAACVAIITIGISLIISLSIAIYLRHIDPSISEITKQGKEDAHADSVREAKERNRAIRRYEKRRSQVQMKQKEEVKEVSHSSSSGDSPPSTVDDLDKVERGTFSHVKDS